MGEIRYKGQVYSGATIGDADYVVYDNTASGLTSTNVQDALDEIADGGGGGGGSTGCVELTQAQYDALSDAEQMEDVIYLITDSPDNYLDEIFGDFASVEYTNTASKAYAVGDYLVYDSKFYKVTSAIVQGATIVPNTNVVKTTVGDEIDQLETALIVNNAEGAIASFPDGGDGSPVRDLKVQMEPIQDLHGYDNPWPAGGGKNKFICFDTTLTKAGLTIEMKGHSVKITGTASENTYVNLNFNGADYSGAVLKNGSAYTWSAKTEGTIPNDVYIYGGYLGSSVAQTSGFHPDGYASTTIPSEGTYQDRVWIDIHAGEVYNGTLYIQTEEGSVKTEYAPYSNICPISGRDSVTVTRTGKNLADTTPQMIGSGLYIQLFGESQTAPDKSINVKSGQTYTLSISFAPAITGSWGVYGRYVDNSTLIAFMGNSTGSSRTAQWTATKDGDIFFWLYSVGSEFTDAIASAIKVQFELGSTATAYEPYNGQSIEIQLGQTVYGGTLDVTHGVLTVDRALVDLGTLNWTYYSSGGRSLFTSYDLANRYMPSGDNNIPVNAMFECYSNVSMYTTFKNGEGGLDGNTSSRIVVCDNRYTDAAAFKSTVSGVQLAYELAAPTTIQLTPQQLTTLLGQNNVWSDADSVSVDYVADTKRYTTNANNIDYSNTTSGLTATNVQSALDETASIIQARKNVITTGSFSKAVTMRTDTTIGTISVPSGTHLVLTRMLLSNSGSSSYNHVLNNKTVRSTELNGGGSTNFEITTSASDLVVRAFTMSLDTTVTVQYAVIKLY